MELRRRVALVLCVVVLVAAAFVAGALLFRHPGGPAQQASGGDKVLYYRNPMNPEITSPTPKKDAMGMDYVPVYSGGAGGSSAGGEQRPPEGAGPNAVRVDARVVQESGVTTELAELRSLSHTVRTVGVVKPDERRLYSVTVKFAGWVERLYVNFVGDLVKKGDPLAAIYSPELLATQREYLLALRHARSLGEGASSETRADADRLLESARRRLLLWDIPEHQIEELARRGEPTRLMTLHAPAGGVVLEKEITAGSQVQPGMNLLRIADLTDVWVFAQIYPYELPWIRAGQRADIEVPGLPGRTLEGRVNYIQPVVSTEARTVEVRIQVSQPGDGILLKPNMYANVEIRSPLTQQAVTVRERAIIRTGERNVVVVALGSGYFEPRDVELGASGDGYVEVLAGVEPGDEVVTSAQFLLDSESNLRSALGAMQPMPGMKHEGGAPSGAPPASQPPAPPTSGPAAPSPEPERRDHREGPPGGGAEPMPEHHNHGDGAPGGGAEPMPEHHDHGDGAPGREAAPMEQMPRGGERGDRDSGGDPGPRMP